MGKIWNFIWKSNSTLSWIVNIILAFIIVKFLIYPGLGLLLDTSHPVVAVVSKSMEHNNLNFEEWWEKNNQWYTNNNITKEEFSKFKMKNGFSKGDIIILKGPKNLRIGDIIVFRGNSKNPIIHRIVEKSSVIKTKGDNNPDSFQALGERDIKQQQIIGKALFKVPLLGWIKIGFVNLISLGG